MKKIFTYLFLLLGAVTLQAQDLDWEAYGILSDQFLIKSADQLSSPYSDEAEGLHIEYLVDGNINTYWHSDWHDRVPGTPYVEVALIEETEGYFTLCMGRRVDSQWTQFTNMEVHASADGETWTNLGERVMPYAGLPEYVISDPYYLPKGTRYLRVYCVGRSHNPGVINELGPGTFHASEMQFYRIMDDYAKEYELTKVVVKYDVYFWGEVKLDMGEGVGQYNDYEAEKAFMAALNEANDILSRGAMAEYTFEEILALIQRIEDSYAAVMASEVPFKLPADGYYRIVCNLDYTEVHESVDADGTLTSEEVVVPKAVYGTAESRARWGTKDDNDCRFLWKMEQVGKGIRMVNAATEEHFSGMDANGRVLTGAEGDTLMVCDLAGNENGRDILYIRFSGGQKDMTGGVSSYLHQLSHNLGKGTGDDLCLWVATYNMEAGNGKGTSEFYLEPVTEEEALPLIDAYMIIKDHDKMVQRYQELINQSRNALSIAKDLDGAYTPDTENPFITDASQLTSLWGDVDEGKSLGVLLDEDPATFWHSDWHGNVVSDYPYHSFEVAMPEGAMGMMKARIQRRAESVNDMIDHMSVYGTDDAALLACTGVDGWTLLVGDLYTPWVKDQQFVDTEAFNVDKPYKYLRFVVTASWGLNYGNRTFFHMGGFQIYPVLKTAHTQYEYMAEAGDRLQALVDAYPTMDLDNLTMEQYNELLEAYNNFGALVVDPAPLRNAIAANRNAADIIELGANPGFWADMSAADALAALIAEAEAYDKTAKLTAEQSQEYIDRLNAAKTDILKAANPLNPNKWYRIRFASQEEYDKYGWNPADAHSPEESLLGKIVVPGKYVEGSGVEVCEFEQITEGNNLHFMDPILFNEDDDNILYRFIPLDSGHYAIRHKLTGLYFQRERYTTEDNHNIKLQIQPTLMKVNPVGKGQMEFFMEDMGGFDLDYKFVNAWRTQETLASWLSGGMGTNSGFYIEEAADVTADDESSYLKNVTPGGIYGLCYPVSMQMFDGTMYTPLGTFEDGGDRFIALKEIETSVPGEPFLFVADGEYQADATATTLVQLGTEVALQPSTVNGLTGHYLQGFIDGGYVFFRDGKATVQEGEQMVISSNEAYLTYGAQPVSPDVEHDLALQIDGHIDTGIRDVVDKLNRGGHIYDLSGQLIKQNGNLNDVKRLRPGTYILNGVKIRVK